MTASLWPTRMFSHRQVPLKAVRLPSTTLPAPAVAAAPRRRHTRRVRSKLQVTSCKPSGEKAQSRTAPTWPRKACVSSHLSVDQSLTPSGSSRDAVANKERSGEKARAHTSPRCAWTWLVALPSGKLWIVTTPVFEPTASTVQSAAMLRLVRSVVSQVLISVVVREDQILQVKIAADSKYVLSAKNCSNGPCPQSACACQCATCCRVRAS
mmetsp:Transcript_57682/g.154513  ORF Transcript_57682/g.154513 Transcript_57682/m.154513 type:complete len:210 (+) Transcript_57682:226-855(+)